MSAPDPSTVPVAELLAERAWVRRFAAALVRDPNDADDLAQDAFASALRSPPRRGTSLRAWFATVLRNRARDAARRRAVAAANLDHAARADADPDSPAALAERAETERRVIAIVLELDEPFRDVVLLRFWQGRSPAEIAEIRGVPAATVRTRLHRALAEVRARLDREDGDRRWIAVLVAPADGVVRAAPSAAARRLAVGVAAAGIVAVGAWLALRDGDSAPPSLDAAAAASRERPAATPTRSRSASRRSGADAREPAPADATPAVPPAHETPLPGVRVRVTGLDGAPVAAAEVWLVSRAPAKDVSDRVRRVAAATAADGTVRASWPWEPGPGRVLARTGALCGASAAFDALPETPVEIRLEAASVLSGEVVDERDVGIEGARLHLQCEIDGDLESFAVAVSDAAGRFSFPSLPASLRQATASIEANADGFATEWVAMKEAGATADAPRIRLARAVVISGRALDENGAPVADVEVGVSTGDNAFTGADGRFRTGRLHAKSVRLGFNSDRHGAVAVTLSDPAPGALDVGDVVLPRGTGLRGRVLFADGRPAAHAWVGVEDTSIAQYVRQGAADAEGRFAFEHLGAAALDLTAHTSDSGPDAGASATLAGVRAGGADVELRLSQTRAITVALTDAATGAVLTPEFVVVTLTPDDGGTGAATSMFDTRDGRSEVVVTPTRDGVFTVAVRVKGYADFGPERVTVTAGRALRVAAKLTKTP